MQNKPYFYNDVNVTSDDLNQILSYVLDFIKTFFTSSLGKALAIGQTPIVSYGVIASPAEYGNLANLKVQANDSGIPGEPQLLIHPGYAVDNNLNLIKVSSEQYLIPGQTTETYSWEGFTGLNYVKLRYQEASASVKPDITGTLRVTSYTQGYFITVDGIAPLSNEITLATFDNSGGTPINITLTDKRQYVSWRNLAKDTILNPDPLVKKTLAAHTTVEDHINAIGRGVVTPTNIHGLSLSDLGGDNLLGSYIRHATESHINGISPIQIGSASAYNAFKGTRVNPTSGAYITFAQPVGSVLFVNGQAVTQLQNTQLTAADAYAIAGDGVYLAVCDASGSVSWLPYNSAYLEYNGPGGVYRTAHFYSQYYILGQAVVSDAGDDISSWTDMRGFYNLTSREIAADLEGYSSPAVQLGSASTLRDNLNRIRWQLGKAINGDNESWDSESCPLTDGPTSDADPYHRHSFDNLLDVSSGSYPNMNVANLAVLLDGITSLADTLHAHSHLRPRIVTLNQSTFTDGLNVQNIEIIRYYGTAQIEITGFTGGIDGKELTIMNLSTDPGHKIVFADEFGPYQRLVLDNGVNYNLLTNFSNITFFYDATSGFWIEKCRSNVSILDD